MRSIRFALLVLAVSIVGGCAGKKTPSAPSTSSSDLDGIHEVQTWMRISHPHVASNLELLGENAAKNSRKFTEKAAAKQTPDERARSERAGAALVKSFEEKHYLRALFQTVEQSSDFDRYAPIVRSWLSEEISTRVLAGRAKWIQLGQTPAGRTEARSYVTRLQEEGSLEQRLALIRRIETSWDEAGLLLVMMDRMRSGLAVLMQTETGNPAPEVSAALDNAYEDAQANLRTGMVETLLLAYQEVGDDDLRRAADFWESPAGRWYVTELHAGMRPCFDRVQQDFRKAIEAGNQDR